MLLIGQTNIKLWICACVANFRVRVLTENTKYGTTAPGHCSKSTWQPILNRYHYGQITMKQIYENMLITFNDVVKSKTFGEKITFENIISVEERMAIENCLTFKPTIAFFGQVNSGKSSVANELLGGGTWLPVSPEPCTSCMVRLKYSKRSYKQQIPFEGEPKPKKRLKENRPTVEDIYFSHGEKKYPHVFRVEMLFGIPNPVLCPNLEFVDLPGWSENSALKETISEAVTRITHPALLPVYVLDGNRTVTSEVSNSFVLNIKIYGNTIASLLSAIGSSTYRNCYKQNGRQGLVVRVQQNRSRRGRLEAELRRRQVTSVR